MNFVLYQVYLLFHLFLLCLSSISSGNWEFAVYMFKIFQTVYDL